jgi:single-strand DNA-binding protein
MSGSANKAFIVGHLGATPEIRETSNGSKLARFTVATNDRWKDQDQNPVEKTEWHRIVIFGRQAKIAEQYLKKGSFVVIEGKIHYDKWTGQDGTERETAEIQISDASGNFTMLGGGGDGFVVERDDISSGSESSTPPNASETGGASEEMPDLDDPPF